MTKDRAYIASGRLLEHFKDIHGLDKSKFLDQNFKKVWNDHDSDGKNYVYIDDADSFFEDLLNLEEEWEQPIKIFKNSDY